MRVAITRCLQLWLLLSHSLPLLVQSWGNSRPSHSLPLLVQSRGNSRPSTSLTDPVTPQPASKQPEAPRIPESPHVPGQESALLLNRRASLCAILVGASAAPAAAVAQGEKDIVLPASPFEAAITAVSRALETLGVEDAVARPKIAEDPVGPPIKRPYRVGRREFSDRLELCPPGDDTSCISSGNGEVASRLTQPFVYFGQKGDAVGDLLAKVYDAKDADTLDARGNFFNYGGVYVLVEVADPAGGGGKFDCEFNFLAGILESVVDVRVLSRDGGAGREARARALLASFAEELGWKTLGVPEFQRKQWTKTMKSTYDDSAIEWRARLDLEGEIEQADRELRAKMVAERKRVDDLRQQINKVLVQLQREENQRTRAYEDIANKIAQRRLAYESGVGDRIGSYKNDGRYAGQNIAGQFNSVDVMINKEGDAASKILKNKSE